MHCPSRKWRRLQRISSLTAPARAVADAKIDVEACADYAGLVDTMFDIERHLSPADAQEFLALLVATKDWPGGRRDWDRETKVFYGLSHDAEMTLATNILALVHKRGPGRGIASAYVGADCRKGKIDFITDAYPGP